MARVPRIALLPAVAGAGYACGRSFTRGTRNDFLTTLIASVASVLGLGYMVLKAPRRGEGLEGPEPHAFFGNLDFMRREWDVLQDRMVDFAAKYGANFSKSWAVTLPRMGAFKGHGTVVMVTTPEAVQHILKDNFAKYEKTDIFNATLKDFIGDGIFASDGERWEAHRKVAVKMFSQRLLQDSSEVAMTQAKKLFALLDKAADDNTVIDLQQCMYAFTMDVFTYIAFGVDLDSQNTEHSFASAFDDCQRICAERFRNPVWELCKTLQLTEDERQVARASKAMRSFAYEVIRSKRREQAAGSKLGPDLISRFLDDAAKKNETITDEMLVDIVLNFLLAGRDTTASALSWTIWELLRNPGALDTARTEILSKVQNVHGGKPLQDLDAKDAFTIVERGLPYLKAVVSEGLRLHPSVPKNIKFAVAADTLPDGTEIEPGMGVMWSPYVLGRSPLLWTDPLKYDPSRWVAKSAEGLFSTAGGGSGITDFKYPTFNCGPRLCIGRPLAYMETQLMLCVLLPRYDFIEVNPSDGTYLQTLVPPMSGGLNVRVVRR